MFIYILLYCGSYLRNCCKCNSLTVLTIMAVSVQLAGNAQNFRFFKSIGVLCVGVVVLLHLSLLVIEFYQETIIHVVDSTKNGKISCIHDNIAYIQDTYTYACNIRFATHGCRRVLFFLSTGLTNRIDIGNAKTEREKKTVVIRTVCVGQKGNSMSETDSSVI